MRDSEVKTNTQQHEAASTVSHGECHLVLHRHYLGKESCVNQTVQFIHYFWPGEEPSGAGGRTYCVCVCVFLCVCVCVFVCVCVWTDRRTLTCPTLNFTSLRHFSRVCVQTHRQAVTQTPYNADCAYANGFTVLAAGLDVKNGFARDRTGDLQRVK